MSLPGIHSGAPAVFPPRQMKRVKREWEWEDGGVGGEDEDDDDEEEEDDISCLSKPALSLLHHKSRPGTLVHFCCIVCTIMVIYL